MALRKHLKDDKHEEQEAIEGYGERIKQHPKMSGMFSEIQGDEKDHLKKLSHALKGLKKAI